VGIDLYLTTMVLDDGYENIPLIGTMALVPQIVDALKKDIQARSIPVVAAGGIAASLYIFRNKKSTET
jgi:hypothetical protein